MRPWIDTHLHLLTPDDLHYDWAQDYPALQRSFDWEHYVAEAALTGIQGVLHMEVDVRAAEMELESDHVALLQQRPGLPRLLGLVAACRPEMEGFEEFIARQREQRPLVRGFRRVLHTQPGELSATPLFAHNLRALARHGYSFDLCVLPQQLAQARRLAEQAPDTQFVLDHCGTPDVAGQALQSWRKELRALAEQPNVACKISGLIAYGRPERWATCEDIASDLRPFVEHAIACFGWDRVVWGSDWPVCTLARSLSHWMQTTQLLTRGCSDSEMDRLAHLNACRIYRL